MYDDLPAALGGEPLRPPGSYRLTPELDVSDADHLIDWCVPAVHDEDMQHLGRPLADGLALDPAVIPTGREAAAFAAELAAVHAPAQDVTVVPASNGTHVIGIALRSIALHAHRLGLRPHRPGSTIIVPGLTWPGTATAALWHGYAPRIADVDPDTLTIDPDSVERLIDGSTVAIVLVDLYARMADRDRLVDIAARHGLALVEDCAHALGAAWGGRAAGTWGDAGTMSFQGSKTVATGEGGAVFTTDRTLGEQVASVVNCGRVVGAALPLVADNDRMAGVVAALGRAQLARFGEQHALRAATFAALDRVAAELPGVAALAAQPRVDVPPTYKWAARYDLGRFAPLTLDQLGAALAADLGVEVSRTYAPMTSSPHYLLDTDPMLTGRADWDEINPIRYDTPNAHEAYESVLCLAQDAGLDPALPRLYAHSVERIQRHADRLATALPR